MPKHLQIESGFEEDVSSMSGSSNRRSFIEEVVVQSKKQRKKINNIMEKELLQLWKRMLRE
jgi:hypothetical protein